MQLDWPPCPLIHIATNGPTHSHSPPHPLTFHTYTLTSHYHPPPILTTRLWGIHTPTSNTPISHTHTHTHPLPPPSHTHHLHPCTPTHLHPHTQATVAGMLSLAYSPETHQYLAKLHIIQGIIGACGIHRTTEERLVEYQFLMYVSAAHIVVLVKAVLHGTCIDGQTEVGVASNHFTQSRNHCTYSKLE